MNAEAVLFGVFGAIALGAALAVVTMRNVVHAALMLVINFLSIAALYLALQSSFLAIGQVIVYAGAIMVLFLFVIMLLGLQRDELLSAGRWRGTVLAVLGTGAVAAMLLFGFAGTHMSADSRCGELAPEEIATLSVECVGLDEVDSVEFLAHRMFGRYTFPFELAAVLLTVATIGAMVMGRRDRLEDDPAFEPSHPGPEGESDLPPLVTDDPEVAALREEGGD